MPTYCTTYYIELIRMEVNPALNQDFFEHIKSDLLATLYNVWRLFVQELFLDITASLIVSTIAHMSNEWAPSHTTDSTVVIHRWRCLQRNPW